MKVLCYMRPWATQYFFDLCVTAFPDAEISYISDFIGVGTEHLEERFYRHYKKLDRNTFSQGELDQDLFNDVRIRCRLLRSIEPLKARRLYRAMWSALDEIIDNVKPDIVFSKTVDSYVIDLLQIICTRKDIPFIGVVATFVNGYFRQTVRGEFNRVREPSSEEVSNVTSKLVNDKYKPIWLHRPASGFQMTMKSWNNQAKNLSRVPYFAAKRILSRDPLNYHYWSSQIVSAERAYVVPRLYVGDRKWKEKLKDRGKRSKVLIPLQLVPEATIDYWCPEDMIDYYRLLLEAVRIFSEKDFTVLVKEHPGVVGLRDVRLYKALKNHANVIVLPPQTYANLVIPDCDLVFVFTGSIGFEAAFRGCQVLHVGCPYYVSGKRFWEVEEISKLSETVDQAMTVAGDPITLSEQESMVRHLLSGLMPGNLRRSDLGENDKAKSDYHTDIKNVAESIRKLANKN